MTVDPLKIVHMEYSLVAVSFVFVCLRLYARAVILGKFSIADVFVIVAWCCYLGDCFVDWYSEAVGMWDPRIKFTSDGKLPDHDGIIKDHKVLRTAFIPLYVIELYCIKMAFLLLYYEIFPIAMVGLRRALYVAYALVIWGLFSTIGFYMFWCEPINRNWTMDRSKRCLAWAAIPPYFYSAAFNVGTDIYVYALPFFLLPTLRNISRRQLTGVAFIFSLGLICIICTLCRIFMSSTSADPATVSLWYILEQFCAISVICCPPLKNIWNHKRHAHNQDRPPSQPSFDKKYSKILAGLEKKMASLSTITKNSTLVSTKSRNDIEEGIDNGAVETPTGLWAPGSAENRVENSVGLRPGQEAPEEAGVIGWKNPFSSADVWSDTDRQEFSLPASGPSETVAPENDGGMIDTIAEALRTEEIQLAQSSSSTRIGSRRMTVDASASVQSASRGDTNQSKSAVSKGRSFSLSFKPEKPPPPGQTGDDLSLRLYDAFGISTGSKSSGPAPEEAAPQATSVPSKGKEKDSLGNLPSLAGAARRNSAPFGGRRLSAFRGRAFSILPVTKESPG